MARTIVRDAMHGQELDTSTSPAALLTQLEQDAERGQWLAIPPH